MPRGVSEEFPELRAASVFLGGVADWFTALSIFVDRGERCTGAFYEPDNAAGSRVSRMNSVNVL